MTIGLFVSIFLIVIAFSVPLSFVLHSYFLSKKPPTPDEARLFAFEAELQRKSTELNLQSNSITTTLQSLSECRADLNRQQKQLHERSQKLDQKEAYLSEGAYQLFVDYVSDSVITRDYLLMTPAFQILVNPDYSDERYSRSLRDMESSIWIEPPFDASAIVSDSTGRYHTTLYRCDCDFFQRFHHPCTHMVRLALEVGGAMCFAPSDKSPSEIKHAKYSPWGNKIWIPIKKDTSP